MKKKYILSIVVLLLVIGSWYNVIDKYAENYINDSFVEASVAYGTARGINALVSMLQTTEIGVGFGVSGSVVIGEVLDPLNDLIERFSDVMAIVLGSLMLQKILLLITSNKIFSIILSVFGLSSIIVVFFGKKTHFSLVFRLFLVLVVIRFSLNVVVTVNSYIDMYFLTEQIKEGNNTLKEHETIFNNVIGNTDITREEYEEINLEIQNKKYQKKFLKQEMNTVTENLKNREKEISWYNVADSSYNNLKSKINEIEDKIDLIDSEIEENEKTLHGDLSYTERLSQLKESLSPSVISKKISDMVDNIFEMLTLFLLQTVLLPLLFFYLLSFLVKSSWNIKI